MVEKSRDEGQTHGNNGTDDESVVMLEDSVVCTLEADVEFCGSVGLHVLESLTGKRESTAQMKAETKLVGQCEVNTR